VLTEAFAPKKKNAKVFEELACKADIEKAEEPGHE
jgi:hypothetical protein